MRSLISTAVFIFILIFSAYLLVELLPSEYLGGVDRVRIVSERIETLCREAWHFTRPILQLIVILIILEWVLSKAGIKLDLGAIKLSWDIRSLLAIIVVIAFSLGALAGSPAVGLLENVCLVVLGFYFGGLSRRDERENTETKTQKE